MAADGSVVSSVLHVAKKERLTTVDAKSPNAMALVIGTDGGPTNELFKKLAGNTALQCTAWH